ncbi:hypothetical protein FISHEDRAFT_63224 [Fistulina hepatica ATCC 64428]|uniref:Cation efflux protein n=1 Tax=Fistulina hepatica ATCC 64428 TaxID=1128425 RepID=A0A0D7AST4_9AGAR|nr:hypothetical protein FISHEDRAFT_63224 [Fistulina hepatica ATCC 64428]
MVASTSSGPEARRHARLHSRNLSVFFPRPGMNAMSEDDDRPEAPVSTIPSAGSSVRIPGSKPPITPLGANFTFGTRPPSLVLERQQAASPLPPLMGSKTGPSTPSRRGHHHKHSVSHNFFSFLEPGASSAPATGGFSMDRATQTASPRAQVPSPVTPSPFTDTEVPGALVGATSMAGAQFLLGAWLWVAGQQVGSLACAGLGYWVVFDAFGVGIASVLPCYLRTQKQDKARRYYGNARIWTVAMFAQAVYLMFASVYHLLLSTGDADEGHHHHHVVDDGDDSALQIDFPLFLIFLTLFTVSTTGLLFNNHSKLINIVGNRIPHPQSLLHRKSSQSSEVPPDSTIGLIVSNPYVLLPLMFSIGILFVALFVDPSVHMMCDLVIAMMIAGSTFHVAYAASVTLGSVLLQTSPARGLPGGKMEAFLRAMREGRPCIQVERHPQVLHLPAPHIWQLTPTLAGKSIPPGGEYYADPEYSELVVTMELHVKDDLPDDDVLRLTRWAWERCVHALGSRGKGHGDEPDVTVSVVRG